MIERIQQSFDIKKVILMICIIALFSFGVFLRCQSLIIPYHHGPDEMVYGQHAYQILMHGKVASIESAKAYVQNSKMWFYPPPTRIGYLLPLTLLMKITHQYNLFPGLLLSLLSSIGSLLLLILIGDRFFNRITVVAALAMYAVCPTAIMLAGRAFQDSFVGFLGLLLIYLSSEIISDPDKKSWYILFILIGSYGLLVKTSLYLFFGLCVLAVLFFLNLEKRQWKKSLLFLSCVFLGFIVVMLVLASWSGGFKNIFLIWYHLKEAVQHNSYAFFQTVSIGKFLLNFYINSAIGSIFFVAALILIPIFAVLKKQRNRIHFGMLFICLSFFLIAALTPHYQNIRYVSILFVPMYLFAGYAITEGNRNIINIIKKQWVRSVLIGLAVLIVLFGCLRDYEVYTKLFVKYRLYDPAPVFMIDLYNK